MRLLSALSIATAASGVFAAPVEDTVTDLSDVNVAAGLNGNSSCHLDLGVAISQLITDIKDVSGPLASVASNIGKAVTTGISGNILGAAPDVIQAVVGSVQLAISVAQKVIAFTNMLCLPSLIPKLFSSTSSEDNENELSSFLKQSAGLPDLKLPDLSEVISHFFAIIKQIIEKILGLIHLPSFGSSLGSQVSLINLAVANLKTATSGLTTIAAAYNETLAADGKDVLNSLDQLLNELTSSN